MFSNIGKKIKTWAAVICWFGIIGAIVAGIVIMVALKTAGGMEIFLGIAEMVVGSISAWLSSFLLYGFGELIDKTVDIERNTRGTAVSNGMERRAPIGQASPAVQSEPERKILCTHCGNPMKETDTFCEKCGHERVSLKSLKRLNKNLRSLIIKCAVVIVAVLIFLLFATNGF